MKDIDLFSYVVQLCYEAEGLLHDADKSNDFFIALELARNSL